MKDKLIALIKEVNYSPFPGGCADVHVEHQLPEHAFETIAEHLIENDVVAQQSGRWQFIREPNTVDTYGNPVYHARCSVCGFTWTHLYDVRTYFKGCPHCTSKLTCPSVYEVWKDCELGQTYKVHTFYTKPDADEWVSRNEKNYPGWHLRVVEAKE